MKAASRQFDTAYGDSAKSRSRTVGRCVRWRTSIAALAVFAVAAAQASAQPACIGDCNNDSTVSVSEIIVGVNIFLGKDSASACAAFQVPVDVPQLVKAVGNVLFGCSNMNATTPTATPYPTFSELPPGDGTVVFSTANGSIATVLSFGSIANQSGAAYPFATRSGVVRSASAASGSQGIGIAFTPDGKRAYISGCTYNQVCIVNALTNEVDAPPITIPDAGLIVSIALTLDGRTAYITDLGSAGNPGQVFVFDTNSQSVIGRLQVPGAFSIAVGPPIGSAAARVYVGTDAGNVVIIDTGTNRIVGSIALPNVADYLAVSPDGSRLYASPGGGQTVSAVDLKTNTVFATVPMQNAFDLAFSPDGSRVFVVNTYGTSSALVIVYAKSATVVDTIPLPANNSNVGVAISPDGLHAFVTPLTSAGGGTNRVLDVELNSGTINPSFDGSLPSFLLAVGPKLSVDGRFLYLPYLSGNSPPTPTVGTLTPAVGTPTPIPSGPAAAIITGGVSTGPPGSTVTVEFSLTYPDVRSQLSTGISAADTVIPISDASRFPCDSATTNPCGSIRIDNEIIEYGGVAGNSLVNARRGTYPSSPVAHTSGSVVNLQGIAGTQNDLTFDPTIPVIPRMTGCLGQDPPCPDCSVNRLIGKTLSGSENFAFEPHGCSGATCTSIRALIVSDSNVNIIPSGSLLYTCNFAISATAALGDHALTFSNLGASDPVGNFRSLDGANGAIVVGYSTP